MTKRLTKYPDPLTSEESAAIQRRYNALPQEEHDALQEMALIVADGLRNFGEESGVLVLRSIMMLMKRQAGK